MQDNKDKSTMNNSATESAKAAKVKFAYCQAFNHKGLDPEIGAK
jgi:hypothetical protein